MHFQLYGITFRELQLFLLRFRQIDIFRNHNFAKLTLRTVFLSDLYGVFNLYSPRIPIVFHALLTREKPGFICRLKIIGFFNKRVKDRQANKHPNKITNSKTY
jgi:hypothetical protein